MKTNRLKQVANNIKAFRKEKGLSQGELADKIKVHLTHISRIETGKYNPSVEDLIKIADVFEVSLDELVSGKDLKNTTDAIQNTPMYQKIRMIEQLDDKDRSTILNVIDCILTRNKFKDFVQQQLG